MKLFDRVRHSWFVGDAGPGREGSDMQCSEAIGGRGELRPEGQNSVTEASRK